LTCAFHLILGFRSSNDQAPLDVSGSAVSKSLQTILGVSRMQLSKAYRQYGDLGDSAASFFQRKTYFVSLTVQPQRFKSIVQVYQMFQKIVATEGRDAKQHFLLQLLRSCNGKTELRFLVRLLIGNMRVGANLKTVLAALAMAIGTTEQADKAAVELIQKTHDICPNLEKIIGALLQGGFEQMQQDCGIQVLTPIAPMLANPIHSLEQVETAMQGNSCSSSMTMEWKYDGVRCQAHYDGTAIKLFSRHMLETTAQYPDAAKSFLEAMKDKRQIKSFILDAEIVGVEGQGEEMRLLPFQDLSRRKRKNDDGQGVRVKVFAFDLMYLNGSSYINKPLWERQQTLYDTFGETEDFAYVSSRPLRSYDEVRLRNFLEEAVQSGAEGLMLKMLGKNETDGNVNKRMKSKEINSTEQTSHYEAGTRSNSWLKVKRDYVAGYADTIDVVPIGAW
jgi:DNA ligase-1